MLSNLCTQIKNTAREYIQRYHNNSSQIHLVHKLRPYFHGSGSTLFDFIRQSLQDHSSFCTEARYIVIQAICNAATVLWLNCTAHESRYIISM